LGGSLALQGRRRRGERGISREEKGKQQRKAELCLAGVVRQGQGGMWWAAHK